MDKHGLIIGHDFPGGNITVESIEGDVVALHQDLRDTEGDWFYWYFRVRGAEARTLTFHFTRSSAIGVRGPAVSTDGGTTWKWLGTGAVEGQSFGYTFTPRAGEVRFSFAMPYLEANLRAFLRRHAGSPRLASDVLCQTKKGRDVELLYLGNIDVPCDHRVVLTSRYHACESMATYGLEGLMEEVLTGEEHGRWLREHVAFFVVPFVDKDGVEDGDQGKNRKPHDHCRDYYDTSIYPSVRAIKQLVPRWAREGPDFCLDMHCPSIRGWSHEFIYFVGDPDQEHWRHVSEFSEILQSVQSGPLPYRVENNLPFGVGWNVGDGLPRACSRWMQTVAGAPIGTTVEIPYANASGVPVTAETARAFGCDLAHALRVYLEGIEG